VTSATTFCATSSPGMGWEAAAGYTFIVSAICAWYTACALMFEGASGKAVLPVGMTGQAQKAPSVASGEGEPGVAKGQYGMASRDAKEGCVPALFLSAPQVRRVLGRSLLEWGSASRYYNLAPEQLCNCRTSAWRELRA
jgi:hypothetical protein